MVFNMMCRSENSFVYEKEGCMSRIRAFVTVCGMIGVCIGVLYLTSVGIVQVVSRILPPPTRVQEVDQEISEVGAEIMLRPVNRTFVVVRIDAVPSTSIFRVLVRDEDNRVHSALSSNARGYRIGQQVTIVELNYNQSNVLRGWAAAIVDE